VKYLEKSAPSKHLKTLMTEIEDEEKEVLPLVRFDEPVEPERSAGPVITEVMEIAAETRPRLGQPDSENDLNFQDTPGTPWFRSLRVSR